MRRRTGAGLAAAAGGAAAAVVVLLGGSGGEDAAAQGERDGGGATAQVRRTTLVDRTRVDGKLGFGDERKVSTRLAGTVTWLPAEGSVVRPGGRLLEVDDEPVVLLDGTLPAYRDLASGIEGDDVLQLERGLRDLGIDPGDVDGDFDGDTASAVRDWQEARGLRETGRVELGRVVFLPGARRVADRGVELGDAVRPGVLTTTSTRRVVTLDLDAADQEVARAGAKVEVELPDGSFAPGRIARVGRVARTPATPDEGGATVEVVIRLTGKERGGDLDQAPVSVELARDRRKGVLAVPVSALVAQRGGGYAVEVVARGGARRLVEVTPGLFADGLVEVEGGVREGDRVAVPAA